MISLKNIHLQCGTKVLFEDLNLTIYEGQKVGLIGINGSGKSSLFSLILRKLKEDKGECYIPANWQIGYLEQETPALPTPAIDYVLQGDTVREALLAQLTIAEEKEDGMAIAHLHSQLQDIDGYTAPARAAQLLDGLGFPPDTISRPVASFSGGWRIRLNLARILMSRSDILMLDEPTNHLDLEAIVWLENWLKQFRGNVFIISHDRDFLDNVIDNIAHLSNKQIKVYSGNYSAFERQRAEQLIIQQKTFEKMQQKRAHLQQFIDRFRAKATKAKQAQSRVKALEKLPIIQAAHMDSPFSFTIPNPLKQPNPLLQFHHVVMGYDPKNPILINVDFSLSPGKRIGLLGLNGAGKSTLIKTLAGEIPFLDGESTLHPDTKIGYFAQHQLDYLELKESALWHLKRLSPLTREQELRDYLGSFNFRGDQALVPIEPFSGGEKSRLALALLVWQRPNLLLLDEPTNHLDREMREALTESLQFYEGAMVIVSHDRHLLRASCDEYYLVEEGQVSQFSSDLDDYLIWRQQQRTAPTKISATATKSPASSDTKKNKQNRLKAIELRLETLSAERTFIETALMDASLYEASKAKELKTWQDKLKKVVDEIGQLEAEWFEVNN